MMQNQINYSKPVFVYRNLKHGYKKKPLYSLMQNGKVLRHTSAIMLRQVRFLVREAGRQRVLRENRKNVHAFAIGYICSSAYGTDRFGRLPATVCYNPYNNGYFFILGGSNLTSKVDGAGALICNKYGMTAAYTYNDEQDMRASCIYFG